LNEYTFYRHYAYARIALSINPLAAVYESHVFLLQTTQLLDAVSRMASLGFEKSYRETVVLMTRSYLNKLSSVGSAESKTEEPEATTERAEVCSISEYQERMLN
jgi:hypothetical protein